MATRGEKVHVEGTDGSDAAFRQRVDDRYKLAPPIKKRLKLLGTLQLFFYAGVISTQCYQVYLNQELIFSFWLLIGVFLNPVKDAGIKRQSASLLMLYQGVCAAISVLLLFTCVGPSAQILASGGGARGLFVPGAVFFGALAGVALHLVPSYLARRLTPLLTTNVAKSKRR